MKMVEKNDFTVFRKYGFTSVYCDCTFEDLKNYIIELVYEQALQFTYGETKDVMKDIENILNQAIEELNDTKTQLEDLQTSYEELEWSYNSLKEDYESLENRYDELYEEKDELLTKIQFGLEDW